MRPDIETTPAFLAGFVAGEGCFTRSATSFTFSVTLGAVDRSMCESFRKHLGVGHVRWYPRRKAHYDDEVVYAVRGLHELVEVIVPFMDEHLPPSYKRQQYLEWRDALLHYWEHHAKRRRDRTCSEPGCERPERAKGLCRGHYYRRYRR